MMSILALLLLAGPAELREMESPTVGVWYHVFYTFDPNSRSTGNWKNVKAWHRPFPLGGKYDVRDPKTIERQVKQMKECGISFIVFDHTNCVHVDDDEIDRNIRVWFDWMDKQPEGERLALAIAPGGELNEHNNRAAWLEAIDYLWKQYASRPSYAHIDGKPLLLWYIGKEVWDDWTDDRWTVRRTYAHHLTEKQGEHEGWGWGARGLPPPNKECMSIMPGWDRPDSPEVFPREDGLYYKRQWFEVLKSQPRFVLIASWNEWSEYTSIEDSTEWKGQYRRLTTGYIAAARRKPLDGYIYETPNDAFSYERRGGKWVKGPRPNGQKTTIVVPDGWFKQ